MANAGGQTHPVAQKQPNAGVFFDLCGNVMEWCWDWLRLHEAASITDPFGGTADTHRIASGGSWSIDSRVWDATDRRARIPDFRSGYLGFRVALARRD